MDEDYMQDLERSLQGLDETAASIDEVEDLKQCLGNLTTATVMHRITQYDQMANKNSNRDFSESALEREIMEMLRETERELAKQKKQEPSSEPESAESPQPGARDSNLEAMLPGGFVNDLDSKTKAHLTSNINNAKLQELPVLKAGYLTKKGEKVQNWKKRWFELNMLELVYKTAPDGIEKGTIPLNSIVGMVRLNDGLVKNMHTFNIPTRGRTYIAGNESAEEAKEWVEQINFLWKEQSKVSRISVYHNGNRRVDFTGTWQLDQHESTPTDEILKALGYSWLDRQIARKSAVTQTITHVGPEVRIQSKTENIVNQSVIVADKLEKMIKMRDGQKFRSKAQWVHEGEELFCTTIIPHVAMFDRPAALVTRRFLENQNTMIVLTQLLPKDSTDSIAARTYYKRVK